ncbi:MAG: hypothetical protein J5983_03990, partial [Ruminococcus sp.]|nr:hypothetical protein [Ruminococcus sp.]
LNQVMKQSKQAQAAAKSAKAKDEKKTTKASAEERAVAAVEMVEAAKAEKKAKADRKASSDKKNMVDDKSSAKEEQTFEPIDSKELEVIIPPEELMETVDTEDTKDVVQTDISNPGSVDIMFATEGNEENSNDRILELHKAGKSNMAIARELGLGIGEVKLVIDLFKGGM